MEEDTVMQPYDREELYRKVWEQPLLKVAEEYGVSAVALGKTCRKLSVPVPGRGHWAKLAYGKEGVKKPPLPKVDKIPVVYRSPVVQRKPPTPDQNDPEYAAINQLLSSGQFIEANRDAVMKVVSDWTARGQARARGANPVYRSLPIPHPPRNEIPGLLRGPCWAP
jgi:hypothetical protein